MLEVADTSGPTEEDEVLDVVERVLEDVGTFEFSDEAVVERALEDMGASGTAEEAVVLKVVERVLEDVGTSGTAEEAVVLKVVERVLEDVDASGTAEEIDVLNVLDCVLEVEGTSELSVEDDGPDDVAISELDNVLDAVLDMVLNVVLKVLLANNASLVVEAIVIDGNDVDCGSKMLVVVFSMLGSVLGSLLSQQ